MTIEEFNQTQFSASTLVSHCGYTWQVVGVDFPKTQLSIRTPYTKVENTTIEVHCEEVDLID